ncbi:hypothetical protein E4T66_20440 [Sinimarinibacterium sp. CAU 1509]|uniref:hypothetical protein n=1 Tax=Sinimarinibacterium sp. CAU 1509 TaxID=2562283 RepID=UPI0010AB6CD8|nr:hypothetical protein [Sinimarinibacterium sp. CAU 1509]TJY55752.1 hypothetical protein E4T66_20440 [Sinimarinibacterium sp. CAU 1509]
MTGRAAEFVGVRGRDLRIVFLSTAGHRRGFYARYRTRMQRWECQLSGYGMQPRRWFSRTQTLALCELRHIASVWDWRRVVIDQRIEWDGVRDTGYLIEGRGQLDMFRDLRDDGHGLRAAA